MPTIVPDYAHVPNVWREFTTEIGLHCCYFCRADLYPPMPEFHTLCARCAVPIITPGYDDPQNRAMYVCPSCDLELLAGDDQ